MTEHDTPEKADTPAEKWPGETAWRAANPGLTDPPTPAILDFRRDRELADRPTSKLHRMGYSAASICRIKGWEAGDVLENGDSAGTAILITAVGEMAMLAREIQPESGPETAWGLGWSDWEARG